MLNDRAKRRLREGLRAFQSPIVVEGHVTEQDLKDYFDEDKASVVFIGGYGMRPSFSWGGSYTSIEFRYINREYTYDDVYVTTNVAAVNTAVCQAVGGYKAGVVVIAPPTVPVEAILSKFYNRYGIFYANYTGASLSLLGSSLCKSSIYMMKISYRIDQATLANMEIETKAEIERLSKLLFLPRMPDVAKAYLAHNYLALTVKYYLDMHASPLEKSYQQSAYGALVRKKCVCQGYAEAFKRLMDAGGVPCEVVCGQITGATYYHAWNIVRLNGGADGYHVDVTWDISDATPKYTYFGKNDGFFTGNRTWDKTCYYLCYKAEDIKAQAQTYIRMHTSELLEKGVPSVILDV